jgi:hypothetical protein
VQNIKNGTDSLGTAESMSGSGKHEDGTPSVLLKTSLGALIIKTGPDALGTAENESMRVQRENGTRCPRYRRK